MQKVHRMEALDEELTATQQRLQAELDRIDKLRRELARRIIERRLALSA